MKVSELIESLQCMDADAEVHFSYNYSDHWRTVVAPRVSQVSEGYVKHSEYHSMDKLVDNEEDIYDEETGNRKENIRTVVVID